MKMSLKWANRMTIIAENPAACCYRRAFQSDEFCLSAQGCLCAFNISLVFASALFANADY
jgi:hypothetical protein